MNAPTRRSFRTSSAEISLLEHSPDSHQPARFLQQYVAQEPVQAGRGLAHVPAPPGVSPRVTPRPACHLSRPRPAQT